MLKKILLISCSIIAFGTVAHSQVMQSDNQSNADNNRSVYIADYDVEQTEYTECTSKIINGSPAGYIACLNQQIKRQHGYIEKFYRDLLEQPQFQKWNGGPTLAKGNFRDMNDQFVAFRDRLCSLFAQGMMSFYNNIEWGRKDCMMNFNNYFLGKLQETKDGSLSDYPTNENPFENTEEYEE